MSEADVIKNTKSGPITEQSLRDDLTALGVLPEMVLVVHSSLSSLGWVNGGAVAVIRALESVLGPEGTLVMPTHSGDLSDPEEWSNPPVPEEWKETIRQTMPPFDLELTPTRGVGRIPETFRKQSGVLRSNHPHISFAAWGKHARRITADHQLDFGLGDRSPLAKIYDLDGWVLLLGVGHDNNTSLHLAEFRAEYPGKKEIQQGAPLLLAGERRWVRIADFEDHSEDFIEVGKAYLESAGKYLNGKIGNAQAALMPQKELIDFSIGWMRDNRNYKTSEK